MTIQKSKSNSTKEISNPPIQPSTSTLLDPDNVGTLSGSQANDPLHPTLLDPDNVGIASASQLNPQEVNDINYLMLDQSNYSLEVVFDRIPKSFIKHTSMLISHCNRHTSNPKLSLSGNLKKQKDVLIRFIALNNEKARLILSDGFQR